MVSQNGRGELIIGDSHEYGAEIGPFDKAEIDAAILDYLETFLDAPPIRIDARWHGTYAKHPDRPYVILSPCPEVTDRHRRRRGGDDSVVRTGREGRGAGAGTGAVDGSNETT